MATRNKVFVDGVHGKTVDRIILSDDDEGIAIEVHFSDNTSFYVRLAAAIQIRGVDLLGWRGGNSRVIKKFV